jgi:hypothetical protein
VLQKNKKLQHAFQRFFLGRRLLENYAQPRLYTLEMLNWLYFIYYAFLSNSAKGKAL